MATLYVLSCLEYNNDNEFTMKDTLHKSNSPLLKIIIFQDASYTLPNLAHREPLVALSNNITQNMRKRLHRKYTESIIKTPKIGKKSSLIWLETGTLYVKRKGF